MRKKCVERGRPGSGDWAVLICIRVGEASQGVNPGLPICDWYEHQNCWYRCINDPPKCIPRPTATPIATPTPTPYTCTGHPNGEYACPPGSTGDNITACCPPPSEENGGCCPSLRSACKWYASCPPETSGCSQTCDDSSCTKADGTSGTCSRQRASGCECQ